MGTNWEAQATIIKVGTRPTYRIRDGDFRAFLARYVRGRMTDVHDANR